MIYRVELEIADRHINDGFRLTEDVLQEGVEHMVRNLGSYRRDVKSEDVRCTIIQEVKFRSNIENFVWKCCDLRSDYWVEASELFRMWCAFRSSYLGKLTTGRFGKLIKRRFPEIKWDRKYLHGRQVAVYRGLKLREVWPGEIDDDS